MSLESRLLALVQAVGSDIKSVQASIAAIPAPRGVAVFTGDSTPTGMNPGDVWIH